MSLSFLTFQPLIPNHNSYDRLSNQTLHETGARDDVQPRCDATRRAAAPPPLDSAMPGPMQGIGTGLLHASPETVDSEAGRPHLPLPRSSLTRHGLLGSRRFHRFYMIDKNRNPPLVFDADVYSNHRCCSRLKILERAQIFSACSIITLRYINRKAINRI